MQDDNIILDSARRLFRDAADIQMVVAARDDSWKKRLWQGIEETGLNIAALPEALDGAGLGLQSALGILRAAGGMALAVPLAETMLAGWVLGAAGLPMPPGKITLGPTSFADRVTREGDLVIGRIARLPFARECEHAVLLADGVDGLSVALIKPEIAAMEPRDNLAHEPADRLRLAGHTVVAAAPAPRGFTADTVLLLGAAARAMQIAGALERILALTTDYVTERRAFERPIAKFQAIQHAIAQLAGETAVSLSAAASAAEALESLLSQSRDFDDPELRLEIMSAKIRTAAAARKASAIAHQMHGAIGVTREHILHRLTLRALAWRDDFGNESEWAQRLGQLVGARGAQALWPLLAGR